MNGGDHLGITFQTIFISPLITHKKRSDIYSRSINNNKLILSELITQRAYLLSEEEF